MTAAIKPHQRPAVFLDRDGTLIEDKGALSSKLQVVFFDDTIPALKKLQEYFWLFIVTNQSGIAEGILSLKEVERVNRHIWKTLVENGIRIKATYVCPHQRSDECPCMKPNPFFLLRAEKEHGIILQRSFVIGDHPHDIKFAVNAGARGIYVLTGHGAKHRDEIPEKTMVASGIGEAVRFILDSGHNCNKWMESVQ